MVGRELGGGAGRTQSGVPMADVKGARSRRRKACERIADGVMDREGESARTLEDQARV